MKKLITSLCLVLCSITMAVAGGMESYRVTITNGTLHHVITPPLIVTHRQGFTLFQIGQPASEGLATLAESGNNLPLLSEVQSSHEVFDTVAAATVIPYGQSASFEIRARKNARISLTGMLASTNDGFVGINSMPLPKKSVRYVAGVFDAGSETNNESCDYIPGPPCGNSNHISDDGEGYVSFHNGVHGGSDLNAKHLDWRGAVAVITIQRIDD